MQEVYNIKRKYHSYNIILFIAYNQRYGKCLLSNEIKFRSYSIQYKNSSFNYGVLLISMIFLFVWGLITPF